MPPQLFTTTVRCAPVPQAGSVTTFTVNEPRLPAPFFVVTEMMLEPLPSILTSDIPMIKLFPFPAWEALSVRTPVAFDNVKIAVPVWFALLL